jgi:hypothetical protein
LYRDARLIGSLHVGHNFHFTPFNLSVADLYNPEIAVGDFTDITKAIYRLQSNSCQITSKYADPSLRELRSRLATEGGLSAFEM